MSLFAFRGYERRASNRRTPDNKEHIYMQKFLIKYMHMPVKICGLGALIFLYIHKIHLNLWFPYLVHNCLVDGILVSVELLVKILQEKIKVYNRIRVVPKVKIIFQVIPFILIFIFLSSNVVYAAISSEEFLDLCKRGSTQEIKKALQDGADVNVHNIRGQTALMHAVERLISSSMNERDERLLELVLLIVHGADVNAKDNEDRTALMFAAIEKKSYASSEPRGGNQEAVAILLASGADANMRDKSGKRAIDYAEKNESFKKKDIYQSLSSVSEDFDGANTLSDIHRLEDKRSFLLLCAYGTQENIELAIKNGADLNAIYAGITVLSMAAIENEDPEVVTLLIKYGSDVNAKNIWGSTALLESILNNANREVIFALLEANADADAKDRNGLTALNLAMQAKRDKKIILGLIERASEFNNKDKDKVTPLILATRDNMDSEIVSALIQRGADVNAKDEDGETSLMFAARSDKPETVAALLDGGADIKAINEKGQNAAYYAKYGKRLRDTEVYRKLVKSGVKYNTQIENNWIHYAAHDFAGGQGTAENPYKIDSAEGLARLAYVVNEWLEDSDGVKFTEKHYVLTSNIDLEGRDWPSIGGLSHFRSSDGCTFFRGYFSGDGHKISNLEISKYFAVGLFFAVLGKDDEFSVIEKLDMDNLSINTGGWNTGGLVGYMRNTDVIDCSANGRVEQRGGIWVGVGGLVGYSDSGTVANCVASVDVTVDNENVDNGDASVGGLLGRNKGRVVNCTSIGDVYGSAGGDMFDYCRVGGLVGYNEGIIENSNASGNVSGGRKSESGTLVGTNSGTIINSAGSGKVQHGPLSLCGNIVVGIILLLLIITLYWIYRLLKFFIKNRLKLKKRIIK
jgi:ankyrin repeat protein